MTNEQDSPQKEKKSRVPHVFAILFIITVFAAILTYIVPAGEYERTEEDGQTVVMPDSFHHIDSNPTGFLDVFGTVYQGMLDGGEIIFFIFILGGAFGIFTATGAIESAVKDVTSKMAGKELLLIPILMLFFALGGATFGMAEETIIFVLILLPLVLRLGFDSMIAAAIPLVGACAGFTAAFMNPFTVGVAQEIAELPIFSGMALRITYWIVFV